MMKTHDVDYSKYSIMVHEQGELALKKTYYFDDVCIESYFDIPRILNKSVKEVFMIVIIR